MERKPRRLLRLSMILFLGGIGIAVCLAALVPGLEAIAGSSQYSGKVAPMLRELDEPTQIYDTNGDYLDTLGLRDRRPAKLSEVPETLVQAVITVEDRSFYTNAGVDLQAMIRAFVENYDAGEVEQGGSTITQQLIKNRFFKNPKRDLDRKIKEAALALRLNNEWSKRRILEEYLNTVYLGQGSYGVKAAAERFFGVPLQDIDLAQSALLAGVIRNPEGTNPFDHPNEALIRRTDVLTQMHEAGYITRRQLDKAAGADMPTVEPPEDFRPDNYYVDEVKNLLLADERLGGTPAERYNKVMLGGLRVETAYDPAAELQALGAVSSTLPDDRFTAALAAMDPDNGHVRAIVAGPGFERSQFNLATMPETGRQPGSTFKAIVLATALENGYSLKDTVDGSSPCTLRIKGLKVDPANPNRTRNAEGSGGVQTLQRATQNSVNCAFFRLGAAVGLDKVIDMAKRLGVTHPLNPYFSLAIGSSDGVSPLDMATVFATFAADGVKHDPVFIKKVEDQNGNVIFEDKGEGERVLDPQIARTVTEALRGVVTNGTGERAQLFLQQSAGKTGTTDRKEDAWFVGYTPQLVAAVWMGDPAKRTPMTNVGRLGAVYGGTYPAIIWQKFMSQMLIGQPLEPFISPDQRLWPAGRYVSENGRNTYSRSGSGSSGSGRSTSSTTKPPPFFGFPPPTTPTLPPPTSPPATTPTTPPASTP
jgi:membrane peptidoglycan carboxypeptidase